jgi:4-hydroxy-3-methylbut-2-enyl diphosphate reductase
MNIKIEIDKYAGFCFGVTKAIASVELQTKQNQKIYCLGKIVHNSKEEERLKELGLKTISYNDIEQLSNENIIIRAHGEPPETYRKLENNELKIIDETCPVVLNLQKKIRNIYNQHKDSQIVIFGKKGHAEVNGLVGQTLGNAKVISNTSEANNIDISKPIFLFSQTTGNYSEYQKIEEFLKTKAINLFGNSDKIKIFQTICPSVIKRIPRLKNFCNNHDLLLFVSDFNSSNGKMLFEVCKNTNSNSYFITDSIEIRKEWFNNAKSIGISGATSTPLWLMEDVKRGIEKMIKN